MCYVELAMGNDWSSEHGRKWAVRHAGLRVRPPISAYLPRTGGSIGRAHPAVSRVAALTAAIQVGQFQLLKPVGRHGIAFGLHVDVVELRGVQPEDLGLVFFGELLVAELLAELVADLEPLE